MTESGEHLDNLAGPEALKSPDQAVQELAIEGLSETEIKICLCLAVTDWESGITLEALLYIGDDSFTENDVHNLVEKGIIDQRTAAAFASESLATRAEEISRADVALQDHFTPLSEENRKIVQYAARLRSTISSNRPELRYRLTSQQLHDELAQLRQDPV